MAGSCECGNECSGFMGNFLSSSGPVSFSRKDSAPWS